MFSSRVPADLDAEPRSRRPLAARRAPGASALIDLTETNPTRVGLAYPPDAARAARRAGARSRYEPHPFGLPAAREAVAADYAAAGARGRRPGRVVLTASTSEAYSLLFKLLCDPATRCWCPSRAIRCSIT